MGKLFHLLAVRYGRAKFDLCSMNQFIIVRRKKTVAGEIEQQLFFSLNDEY